MARKQDNSGCGLAALCLVIIVAIGKCSGGGSSTDEQASVTAPAAASPTISTIMHVASASLNCRAEPAPDSRVVEKLSRSDQVDAGETKDSWVKLDRIGGDCWVAQRFLSEGAPDPEPAESSSPLYSPPPSQPEVDLAPRRSAASCGIKWKCGQMDSCAEAYHYLNDCGVGRLDGDGDGVPCESIC
ncbi:excalibur calcium-binding domain-containing protein [Sphingobium lactosutens]|uniref:excalibur calcium-binding domain-containing protein n=1 Tax=Sphingobium lactosutens TaxID=522773 RepID=UPI001C4B1ACF|nr:excalibur calcium-binding domain-containing protein [Sphingobium lactosutens]